MTTIVPGEVVPAAKINQWAPPGVVVDFAGATVPDGWLLCDGASYLRSDYPDLFTAIGTTYGAADGSHFNVPDCRGRVPVGHAVSGGHTDVATLGNNDGVALASRRPLHSHTINLVNDIPNSGIANAPARATTPTGVDGPAYIVLNKMIRAKDV